jgi:hypothetical protein
MVGTPAGAAAPKVVNLIESRPPLLPRINIFAVFPLLVVTANPSPGVSALAANGRRFAAAIEIGLRKKIETVGPQIGQTARLRVPLGSQAAAIPEQIAAGACDRAGVQVYRRIGLKDRVFAQVSQGGDRKSDG